MTEKLNRRAVVARLLRDRGEAMVVTGLGNASFDVMAAGDSPRNFYLWGAMGGAAMVGLGIALAQPTKPVLVITGDGDMLMGLGSLATIAVARPRNLSIVVLDNEYYAETGMQMTHTGKGVNLEGVAKAAGFSRTGFAVTEAEVDAMAAQVFVAGEPYFGLIKVSTERNPTALPPRDGPYLRARFRESLMGTSAHQ